MLSQIVDFGCFKRLMVCGSKNVTIALMLFMSVDFVYAEREYPVESLPFVSVEFSQWQQAHQAKQSLLARIVAICPQGFEVFSERYVSKPMGKFELSLVYGCIMPAS